MKLHELNNGYKKPATEFPKRIRHYFRVEYPEDIMVAQPIEGEKNAWMDLLIEDVGEVGMSITIEDYGVIIDKFDLRKPDFITPEMLQAEKGRVCLR